jgi:hypothetical protein
MVVSGAPMEEFLMARQPHERFAATKPEPTRTHSGVAEPVTTLPNAPITWGWQVALFLWVASFLFLFLNDLLTCAFKIGTRLLGG